MAKKKRKEQLPDVDITLTANEMNALNDEKGDLWKFYITISRCRDFVTNIAGQRTRINADKLKEAMSLTKKQGRPAFKPSGGSLENWIKRLGEIGLLINKNNYVFELPLAPTHKSGQNKSDRGQTEVRQEFRQNISSENPIKIDIKLESNDRSQTISQTGSETEVRLPLNNRLHNITLHSAPDFFQLLAENGFYLNQLHGNKKTLAMVHQWVQAGITLEEARIGINHVNTTQGKPNSPTYYLKPVLQVRQDFEKARQQAQEINNHANNQSNTLSTPHNQSKRSRITRAQRNERMDKWVAKKLAEQEIEDGSESDTLDF